MKRFQVQSNHEDGWMSFQGSDNYEQAIRIMRDAAIEGDTMRVLDTELNVVISNA